MNRLFRMLALATLTALVAVAAQVSIAGQAARPVATDKAKAAASTFTPSKTPWGDPDLQGHWLPGGGGRMETPAGKPWETPATTGGAGAAFSNFFGDEPRSAANAARARAPQTPMVVEPADGRIPLQPWAAEKRN